MLRREPFSAGGAFSTCNEYTEVWENFVPAKCAEQSIIILLTSQGTRPFLSTHERTGNKNSQEHYPFNIN